MKRILMFVLFIAGCGANGPEEMVVQSIYAHLEMNTVTSIEVLKYDSLHSTHYTTFKTITDSSTINQLIDLLKKMPAEGEIMISFNGSVPYQKVLFREVDDTTDTIEIIANQVKTPATSFYDPARGSETKFVEMILAR